MRDRTFRKLRPAGEALEEKQLLSARASTIQVEKPPAGSGAFVSRAQDAVHVLGRQAVAERRRPVSAGTGFLAFRVTKQPYKLVPPFAQVLVQSRQPVPGQVYNVNYVALKNGTRQTFDASSGFTVRLTNQSGTRGFPILTGSEQWKPEQVIVFYVLTKKYYPVSFVAGGFQFDLGGRSSTLVPGPSGIFLRLNYNPATFARTLDWIVAFGQGAQLGLGPKFGLPDTAINTFVSAKTQRIDFGGHF
jgi:hypothetical protein